MIDRIHKWSYLGLAFLFWEHFKITNSMCLTHILLFIFSIYSSVSFGNFCLSKKFIYFIQVINFISLMFFF